MNQNIRAIFIKGLNFVREFGKYNSSLPVTHKAARKLMDSDIPSRLKLYLTLFSNLDRSATVRSETRKGETHARGKKGLIYTDITPFKRFPDVREFKINLKGLDGLFAAYNMKAFWKPEFTFKKYKNAKINRYLVGCLLVLKDKLKKGDRLGFWNFSMFLLRRSKVFFANQLRHTSLNGHREYKYHDVLRMYEKYRKIANTMSFRLDYKRVYIPKSDLKVRPLGVPSGEGRIYLGLLNKFLGLGIKDFLPESQHGFQPKKGTLTAGKEFFEIAVNKRNIYEFDLKSFFDTVNLQKLFRYAGQSCGLPFQLCCQLILMNMLLPPKMMLVGGTHLLDLDETIKQQLRRMIEHGELSNQSASDILMRSDETRGNETSYIAPGEPTRTQDSEFITLKHVGVAQGAPTSPLLAILILNTAFAKFKGKLSMYADDGYLYFDNDDELENETFEAFKQFGILFNKEKSGGVKRKGKGLKPFKFLGLEFDGEQNLLRAKTRKGSVLIYDKQQLVDLVNERMLILKYGYNTDKVVEAKSFNALVSSSIYGLIQSRLYLGNWTLDNIEQDFRMKFIRGSGMDRRSNRALNVFVSTSFATSALLNDLRKYKGTSNMKNNDGKWGDPFAKMVLLRTKSIFTLSFMGNRKMHSYFTYRWPVCSYDITNS